MGQTVSDWSIARVHGAPVYNMEDGYESLAVDLTTAVKHENLRRNTVYRVTVNGADAHLLLLSENDIVTDGYDVSTTNCLFLHDGETIHITTKASGKTYTRVDGNKEEKVILAVRTASGTAVLYATIMDARP